MCYILHILVNDIFMNIFISKNRVIHSMSVPIACTAFVLLVLSALSLLLDFDSNLIISFAYSAICPGFIALYYIKNHKTSLCLSSAVLLLNLLYYALSGEVLGLGFITLYSALLIVLIKKLDLFYAFILSVLLSVMFAVILFLLASPFQKLLNLLAATLYNKPTLFGVVNNVYSMLFGNELGNLIYHKSYGGAVFSEGEIVSGVISSFLNKPDAPSGSVSAFLTGQYFTNIFLPIGIFLALFSRIKEHYLLPFSLTMLLSIVFGNNILLGVFLFFYNPFLYFGYLLTVFICYLVPRLMHLSIGFAHHASLFELISYGNNWVYFILIGFVLTVMMYFVCILVLSKYDLASKRYFPKEVKALVNALGGERNIINIDQAKLYVTNPNLIDVLKVDCEIKGNEITLIDSDLELLYDYFS